MSLKAIVIAAGLMVVGIAHAVTPHSNSVKYFDENGTVVGQQILLCNNSAYHAGNIHTAYMIREATTCGDGQQTSYIVPDSIITSYTLPGSVTIGYACTVAECEPGLAAEPERLLDKGWTWAYGWQ
jgi:hypothetical protein